MKLVDRAMERLLERLRLPVKARTAAGGQGGHRSETLASGVEFADHRQYVPGDDVRRIDWKAFARHRQFVVREFQEERDARVHVLCDLSASMTRGTPPKALVAKKLAAALAYIATKQFDRVLVLPFAEGLAPSWTKGGKVLRARTELPELDRDLEAAPVGGYTDFADAVRVFSQRHASRGLTVVFSDFLSDTDFEDGLRRLASLGQELLVVRIGCQEDDEPDLQGELELFDAESGESLRLRSSAALIAAYQREVRAVVEGLQRATGRLGGRFVEVRAEQPVEVQLRRLVGLGGGVA